MITFDDVLPAVLGVGQHHVGSFEKIAVIRDLKGRIRVAVRPRPIAPDTAASGLEGELARELMRYFAPPVLSTTAGEAAVARLANNLINACPKWPSEWPSKAVEPLTGAEHPLDESVWCGMQRVLSKQSWLGDGAVGQARAPWPAHPKTPGLVSFYSFKGGVGRSTLLAAVAWWFAKQGKKVAVVDLDLEAPGLGPLFGVQTRRGVIDFVVDHLATGDGELADMYLPAPKANAISVFPAGTVSWSFLEKLARLDFAGSGLQPGQSPVEEALRKLLEQVRRAVHPDVILIDSRAGLHDLGGLSLHGLSHVDVLLARANEQSYVGLELSLRAILRRRGGEVPLLVVHAFAPSEDAARESETAAFGSRVYRIFEEHLYATPIWDDDAPNEDADDAPHAPRPFSENPLLARLTTFADIVRGVADGEELSAIASRLEELLSGQRPEAEDAGDVESDADEEGAEDDPGETT